MDKLKTITIYGKTYEIGSGGASSWNDLTDKPFYTEGSLVDVLPSQDLQFTAEGGMGAWAMQSTVTIEDGKTYKVTWDGIEYECVGKELEGMNFIGNTMILGAGEDTNEPFVVFNDSGAFTVYTNTTETSHTVAIQMNNEVVHTLDPKYLPTNYIKDLIDEVIGEALNSEV